MTYFWNILVGRKHLEGTVLKIEKYDVDTGSQIDLLANMFRIYEVLIWLSLYVNSIYS